MRAVRTPERDRILGRIRGDKYRERYPDRSLWRQLHRRAPEGCMSRDEFCAWYNAQAFVCVYCGMSQYEAVRNFRHKLHVDRKEPDRPYIASNIVFACHRCNVVKSRYLTFDQMREVAARYFNGYSNAHEQLVEALEECREYFDNRADADCQGDPARYVPNEAMQMLGMIDAALAIARSAK